MKTHFFFVASVALFVVSAGHAQITVDRSGNCYIGMKPATASFVSRATNSSVSSSENLVLPTLNIGVGVNIIADRGTMAATVPVFTLSDSREASSPCFSVTADGNNL